MLPEEKRNELDAIVKDMINNKESEYNIRFVVDDFKKKYSQSINNVNKSQPIEKPFTLPGQETAKALSTGVAKGIVSTVGGLASLGKKVTTGLGSAVGIKESVDTTPVINKLSEISSPQGVAENIGYGAEKLAEFFIPASKAAKAESAINILAKGIKNPLLSATTKIVGKSVVQGLSAGTIGLAQTGDVKKATQIAATAGIVRGGFATIGEGARALRLPERLYSTLFKNTADDMLSELKTETLAGLQKNDPAKYQILIDKGIIKASPTGEVQINPTLAKQALDSGLRGSIRNMARTMIEGTLDSESKVLDIAKTYKGTVNLTEKQFPNVLKSIAQEYEDVGFGEISSEANKLASTIESSNGKVTADIALATRRLLDRARVASSFEKPISKMSLTQANLKVLADTIRSRVNAIPGMGETMGKYSFYIDALETLAKEAARRGNNQAISLIDSLFLSGGLGATSPIPGLTAGMFRKYILSGPGMTSLAQFLNKGVASAKTIGAINTGANLSNQLLNQ